MNCISCNHPNTATAKFCENCGKPITREETICPKCGAERKNQSRFCPNCGHEYKKVQSLEPEKKEYCPHCGIQRVSQNKTCLNCSYSFDDTDTSTVPTAPASSAYTTPKFRIKRSLLLCASAVIMAWFLLSDWVSVKMLGSFALLDISDLLDTFSYFSDDLAFISYLIVGVILFLCACLVLTLVNALQGKLRESAGKLLTAGWIGVALFVISVIIVLGTNAEADYTVLELGFGAIALGAFSLFLIFKGLSLIGRYGITVPDWLRCGSCGFDKFRKGAPVPEVCPKCDSKFAPLDFFDIDDVS